jgi:8-oxo-dGTP pyrophosphatase MutT (NUDIX family)
VRFDAAAARLAALPHPIPAPAGILMPVLIGEPRGGPPRVPPAGRPGRPAAVLALVFPDEDGIARIVLIERTSGGNHHGGEVSLPGGKAEPEDADATATALREAAEEVALDTVEAGVRVVGTLDTFWIPVSDFAVTPVVAVADRRPRLRPAPTEVARILDTPMERFLPGAPIVVVERTVRDWPLRYGSYEVEGLSVWGATARILSQLGAVLADG